MMLTPADPPAPRCVILPSNPPAPDRLRRGAACQVVATDASLASVLSGPPDRLLRSIVVRGGMVGVYELRPSSARVIIPAAGRGSRFAGASVPKVLAAGVHGRPLILRVLDAMAMFDPSPIVVVNPQTGPLVRDAVDAEGLHRPTWVLQNHPLGMGHAVLCAEDELRGDQSDDVLIAWGDMGALPVAAPFVASVLREKLGVAATVPTRMRPLPYAGIVRGSSGMVVDIFDRRHGVAPRHGESDCGVFSVSAGLLFRALRELCARSATEAGEVDFLPVLRVLAQQGHAILPMRVVGTYEAQGVNTTADLAMADTAYAALTTARRRRFAAATTIADLLDTIMLMGCGAPTETALSDALRRMNATTEILAPLPRSVRRAVLSFLRHQRSTVVDHRAPQ